MRRRREALRCSLFKRKWPGKFRTIYGNSAWHCYKAETVNAPIINEMLLSLECEVVHTVTVGSHTQVTGEVKRILADESILNDKDKIVLEKLRPIIYDEEQVRYLEIGQKVSDAFKPGTEMKKAKGGTQ